MYTERMQEEEELQAVTNALLAWHIYSGTKVNYEVSSVEPGCQEYYWGI
jgi:hypothetical protein